MFYSGEGSLGAGTLVGYNLTKSPAIAVVMSHSSAGVRLMLSSRREFHLKPQAVFLIAKKSDPVNREKWIEDLFEFEEQSKEAEKEIDLLFLHEILEEEGGSYSLKQLCQTNFGNHFTPFQAFAMSRVLDCDSCYFKQKKENWLVQSKESVIRWQEQQVREQKKKELLISKKEWLESKSEWSLGEEELVYFQKELLDLGFRFEKSAVFSKYKELLDLVGIHTKAELKKILIQKEILSLNEPFELYESLYPCEFSPAFLSYIESFDSSLITDVEKDLSHLETFTIDSEHTTDRDDAFSYDPLQKKLWIHIANVASWVNGNERIEKEIQKRLTSLYLPDGFFPMFPREITEKILSLDEGKTHSVMTLECRIRDEEIYNCIVYPAKIHVKKNLSYKEVEENRQNYEYLYSLSAKLLQIRLNQGAIVYSKEDLELEIDEQQKVSISKKSYYPSQEIIAEMAIVANQEFARFCERNQIPILYRAQSGNLVDLKKQKLYAQEISDFFVYYRLKKFWGRTRWEVNPEGHFTLGVERYTQMTSPMRRYIDYVNQKQLFRWFQKKPLLSKDDLQSLILEISGLLYEFQGIQDKRKRFWMMKMLQDWIDCDFPNGVFYEAIVLESGNEFSLVWIEELQTIFKCDSKSGIKIGDMARICIRSVDLHEREARVVFV